MIPDKTDNEHSTGKAASTWFFLKGLINFGFLIIALRTLSGLQCYYGTALKERDTVERIYQSGAKGMA